MKHVGQSGPGSDFNPGYAAFSWVQRVGSVEEEADA